MRMSDLVHILHVLHLDFLQARPSSEIYILFFFLSAGKHLFCVQRGVFKEGGVRQTS